MTQIGRTTIQTISVSATITSRYLSKTLSTQLTDLFRRVVSAGPSETLIQATKRERQLSQLRVVDFLTKQGTLLCAPGSTL